MRALRCKTARASETRSARATGLLAFLERSERIDAAIRRESMQRMQGMYRLKILRLPAASCVVEVTLSTAIGDYTSFKFYRPTMRMLFLRACRICYLKSIAIVSWLESYRMTALMHTPRGVGR